MTRDRERIERLKSALRESGSDALVCALPLNVLLLSGYWPVIGTSLAIVTREGQVTLLVPEDERELAKKGWADVVRTFKAGSLSEIKSTLESVRGPLAAIARDFKLGSGKRLGYEDEEMFEPVTYPAMHFYGVRIKELLDETFPSANLVPAGELLTHERSVLTLHELNHLCLACRIAEEAFIEGSWKLHAGLSEVEAAAQFRTPLATRGIGRSFITRADGFVSCMSGANSAEAFRSYARSRSKIIAPDEFALVHCNSYADGFWTDITRTFCIGNVDERKRRMYEAVFAARKMALNEIRPGAKASDVDRKAREVISEFGFGREFKHGLGHGVGFSAINHNALPRLHPASTDTLETGMVFNVEPAIYIEGFGGLRHCDMVVVTEMGAEVLTPFLSSVAELMVA